MFKRTSDPAGLSERNKPWVSCADFLVGVVLHITSLKDLLFGFQTTANKYGG